jgi:hypothetical protein
LFSPFYYITSFHCRTTDEVISQIRLFEDFKEEMQDEYLRYSKGKVALFGLRLIIYDWHIDSSSDMLPERLEEINVKDYSKWKMPKIRFVEIRKATSGHSH